MILIDNYELVKLDYYGNPIPPFDIIGLYDERKDYKFKWSINNTPIGDENNESKISYR